MSYSDDEDDDALDDRELPDESDMDPEGEDETETDPCPFCRRPVYTGNEFCPHCGRYIRAAGPSRKTIWFMLAITVCLFIIAVFWII